MKYRIVLILIILATFLTACQDVEQDMEKEIMSDIPVIGWFWRMQSTPHIPDNADIPNINVNTDNVTYSVNSKLPEFPKDNRCPKEHQYWNMQYATCVCEADYYMQDGACVAKTLRECVVDRDCSSDGQLSVCATNTAKRVYYCDLNNYKCIGGKGNGMVVDCKTEYGSNYRCINGACVT